VVRARGARRRLGIGRAGRAGAGAVLLRFAFARRGATERAAVACRMLAGVARPVALVRTARVAVIRAGGAGRTLRVRRTARGGPRAHLRGVTLPCRRTADDEAGQEPIRRAARARPGARLDVVADVGRRPAHGAGVPRRVLAGVARPVAFIRAARVAVVRARGARRRLGIGRAGRAGAGAVLLRVARAGRGAAEGAGVTRRMLAGVAAPVALIGAARVAVVGAGRARGALGVRRAARPGARAHLRRIALARRGAADDEA